jgi:hypothetical protein
MTVAEARKILEDVEAEAVLPQELLDKEAVRVWFCSFRYCSVIGSEGSILGMHGGYAATGNAGQGSSSWLARPMARTCLDIVWSTVGSTETEP